MNSEDADGLFDENEKAFLIEQYSEMKVPLYYEDYDGWKSALSYAQTIIMLIMLVSAFLVSGIFSNEFSWKSDSIFFSTKYGRDRGTRAKIMAGFIVVSAIYFIVISLYSLVVLGCLGSQGGNVMIQTGFWHWKSFYNITYMQLYLLTVIAGYIGTVFCLFLSMIVSAKTHTAVVAVTIPFAILFYHSLYQISISYREYWVCSQTACCRSMRLSIHLIYIILVVRLLARYQSCWSFIQS